MHAMPRKLTSAIAATASLAAAYALLRLLSRRRPLLRMRSTTMRQLRLLQPAPLMQDAKFEVANVPIPTPGPNQVLVKVRAAAVNPADYGGCRNLISGPCPRPLGIECSGEGFGGLFIK